jgi:nitrogenase molybdenum-iron protein alpha/beta subunit
MEQISHVFQKHCGLHYIVRREPLGFQEAGDVLHDLTRLLDDRGAHNLTRLGI